MLKFIVIEVEVFIMYWAKEIALEIIEERPDNEIYTVASGISPSGFIHIGNFREIATPYLVALELLKLGKKVRYILSWDDFDRYRKTPGNIDKSFDKYIGIPYTSIPSPFNEGESYAKTFENIFMKELIEMGVDNIEFIYQTEEYKNFRYLDDIKFCMKKRKEIFDIICSFKTQDFCENDRNNSYPISIYCSKCMKDLTQITNYNDETEEITYKCECGNEETVNINEYNNLKLVWKVDWPMRWKKESVDFECGGRDHSTEGGSFDVSSRISREIFNYEPPIYSMYDFIGIKGGEMKMSSSKGNVITITDALKVYDKYIFMWFYAKCKCCQAFDIAFDEDVIRYYQEFDRWVKAYFEGNIDEKNKDAIDNTKITEKYLKYPNFSYLATFLPMVNYDRKLLKELLSKEGINTESKYFDERLEKSEYWVKTYGERYQVKLLKTNNKEYYDNLNKLEKSNILKTINILSESKYTSSDELQTLLYDVVKEYVKEESELKKTQKKYFEDLYNLLLGASKGPKLGLFLIAADKEEVINLLTF